MNYQLPNGRTLTLSTEEYIDLTDEELQKKIEDAELGIIPTLEIENQWFESHKEEIEYKSRNTRPTTRYIPSIDDLSSIEEDPEDTALDIPFQQD